MSLSPIFLDHLRATFSPSSQVRFDQRFEEVRRAPLLVLDDLGTESASPWAQEKLYQLFNYRYIARLPTIITMTQEPKEVDPRLRTRMADVGRCTIFSPSTRPAIEVLLNAAKSASRTRAANDLESRAGTS